jgi:hypothetical protein
MKILTAASIAAAVAAGTCALIFGGEPTGAPVSVPALTVFLVVFVVALVLIALAGRADRRRADRRARSARAASAAARAASAARRQATPISHADHVVYSAMRHLDSVQEWHEAGCATAADVDEARDDLRRARLRAGRAASRSAYERFHHVGRS